MIRLDYNYLLSLDLLLWLVLVRIFLREKFTQYQGAQAQAHNRQKSMINMKNAYYSQKHVHTH